MRLFFQLISAFAVLVMLSASGLAAYLYYEFNFGSCRDGCAQGMAYALFLPAAGLALVAGITSIGALYMAGQAKTRR